MHGSSSRDAEAVPDRTIVKLLVLFSDCVVVLTLVKAPHLADISAAFNTDSITQSSTVIASKTITAASHAATSLNSMPSDQDKHPVASPSPTTLADLVKLNRDMAFLLESDFGLSMLKVR